MMTCPVCGKSGQKEWNHCHPRQGEPVCVECCRDCKYSEEGSYRCMHFEPKKERMNRVDSEIAALERKQAESSEQAGLTATDEIRLIILRNKKRCMEEGNDTFM